VDFGTSCLGVAVGLSLLAWLVTAVLQWRHYDWESNLLDWLLLPYSTGQLIETRREAERRELLRLLSGTPEQ
jgi:hypothetical protein